MKLTYLAGLLALVLAGCATQQPQATIDYAAKLNHVSRLCATTGLMDQETAAKGIAIASKQIYSSEVGRANARMEAYRAEFPSMTRSQCDDTRLHILGRVAGGALTPATAAPAYQQPTTTRCQTYFGQTHCQTF